MGLSIRTMERADIADVCQLLTKVFGDNSSLFPYWEQTLEWLYFSPEITDQVPRGLVIADEHSIVGHIGLTLSEFTDGEQSFTVVQPENWAVDPDHKAGLLSLRLMMQAASVGDVAIIIGGTQDTQRIVAKIGFEKQSGVDRYLKVMRPWAFLWMVRSRKQLARNAGKLIMFLATSLLRFLQNRRPSQTKYRMQEMTGQLLDPNSALALGDSTASPGRTVLRNTLKGAFLNWYRQCPRGSVRVLGFFHEGAWVGQAALIIGSRKGNCYATILNVDASTEDESVWINILGGVEDFLRKQGITHINALGSYEPWRRALQQQGYCKLKNMPFWLRDKSHKLTGRHEWHLTAIEGDLGYLVE
ncbi:MAG: GNAT family N-acetyltransferase [Acidobacteria bacterium]|nr:GNAT family N-acetyltransferase [Acidobacteriota bacterium]